MDVFQFFLGNILHSWGGGGGEWRRGESMSPARPRSPRCRLPWATSSEKDSGTFEYFICKVVHATHSWLWPDIP